MIDLEQEFQLLMRTVVKQIEDKVNAGALTRPEANQLLTMVNTRMQPPEQEAWSASTQACMDAYQYEEDEAWSSSSRDC